VKAEKVLERVYEWGRLRLAWKQVERNAGAAGIDEMTVGPFREKEEDLLREIQEKVQSGIYRFQLYVYVVPLIPIFSGKQDCLSGWRAQSRTFSGGTRIGSKRLNSVLSSPGDHPSPLSFSVHSRSMPGWRSTLPLP
jgi:hypothetical protein